MAHNIWNYPNTKLSGVLSLSREVGLYHCEEYNATKIQGILEEAFNANPQWLEGITSGCRVYLKLNLLMKKKPEDAVTTHPALVEALVRILQGRGAQVTIGDSPGGPYLPGRLKSIYRTCGMEEVALKTGAALNYDVSETLVHFPEGKVSKAFYLTSATTKADKIIALPKLKTHMMTKYTGAVKNLFGTIPGMRKADYHLKMTNVEDFCDMLVDLNLCVKPALHIMDAVVGMEGNGPSGGTPRNVGALLISSDPFALDVAAMSLVKINPQSVPTVTRGVARGRVGQIQDIIIQGSDLNSWDIKPFIAPKLSGHVRFERIPEFITRFIRPKPVFIEEKCKSCGDCVTNCPPGALTLVKGYPVIDLNKCIRCFCCQELCPQQAIIIRRNPIGKLMER